MLVPILKVAGHFLMIAESSQSVTVTKQAIAGTQLVARPCGFKHRPKLQLGPKKGNLACVALQSQPLLCWNASQEMLKKTT